MTVVFNDERSNEIKLRLFIEVDEHDREYFDHHDTLEEMLESVRNVIKLARHDGVARVVGIIIVQSKHRDHDDRDGLGTLSEV